MTPSEVAVAVIIASFILGLGLACWLDVPDDKDDEGGGV